MTTLFAGKTKNLDIHGLVERIKDYLSGEKSEQRHSDFYPSGLYFKVEGEGFSIKVSDTDDEEFNSYEITLAVNGTREGAVKDQLAKFLLLCGYEVVRPETSYKGAQCWQPILGPSGDLTWNILAN